MMDRASLIFCAVALGAVVVVSALAFPYAARPRAEIAAAKTPVDAATLGDIAIPQFGAVSVSELMTYYIDNPPRPKGGVEAGDKKTRFQGC